MPSVYLPLQSQLSWTTHLAPSPMDIGRQARRRLDKLRRSRPLSHSPEHCAGHSSFLLLICCFAGRRLSLPPALILDATFNGRAPPIPQCTIYELTLSRCSVTKKDNAMILTTHLTPIPLNLGSRTDHHAVRNTKAAASVPHLGVTIDPY